MEDIFTQHLSDSPELFIEETCFCTFVTSWMSNSHAVGQMWEGWTRLGILGSWCDDPSQTHQGIFVVFLVNSFFTFMLQLI